MRLHRLSVCQLTFLCLCCVLFTVRQSNSTFVPGRCLCPVTQRGIRGQLKDLIVHNKSPTCNKVTVIVKMKIDDRLVCVDPEGRLGRQLARCWNRVQELGRDIKVCLRRMKKAQRRGGKRLRSRQRIRAHVKKASSSHS